MGWGMSENCYHLFFPERRISAFIFISRNVSSLKQVFILKQCRIHNHLAKKCLVCSNLMIPLDFVFVDSYFQFNCTNYLIWNLLFSLNMPSHLTGFLCFGKKFDNNTGSLILLSTAYAFKFFDSKEYAIFL